MKYLYVLTSSNSDLYLEQVLLSIQSLRIHNPKAFISILTDDKTELSLTDKRKILLTQIDEIISVNIDEKYNQKARSRWLKTSMRQHISGDFLYLDCDTIIADDLSDIDNYNIDIGAVLNAHAYLSDLKVYHPKYLQNIQTLDKKLNFSSSFDSNTHFNGGLFLCKDNPIVHNFFNEWHNLWQYCYDQGVSTDQQSLNQANFIHGNIITELDGKWNCQIASEGAINYLHNAKIIHYFAEIPGNKPYYISNENYLLQIKKTGIIDQTLIDLISRPKSLFSQHTRLILMDKDLRSFHNSAMYAATKRIYNSKFGLLYESLLLFFRKYLFIPIKKIILK